MATAPTPPLPPLRFEPEAPRTGSHLAPVVTMVRVWRGGSLEACLHRQRKTVRSAWDVRISLSSTMGSVPLKETRVRLNAVLDACESYVWPDVVDLGRQTAVPEPAAPVASPVAAPVHGSTERGTAR